MVFFARENPSKYEILNDINSDLVTFYRVLQHHLEEFCRQFKWLLCSREIFDDWSRQLDSGGLTDIQRAARFYYLQKLGFNGRVVNRSFASGATRAPHVNLLRLEEELSQIHIRLTRATIENLPWSDFVRKYDRPETFYYLDPPYYRREYFYGPHFARDDFGELARILAGISSKFLMSINDTPEVRDIFQDFNIDSVSIKYSAPIGQRQEASELLISNF